jgi:RNA polymerase sigma-70 factor (ECF subfamily)
MRRHDGVWRQLDPLDIGSLLVGSPCQDRSLPSLRQTLRRSPLTSSGVSTMFRSVRGGDEAAAKAALWARIQHKGTDLRAWLFTILHNQFVNNIRRSGREGPVLEVSDLEEENQELPAQDKRLELRDLDRALSLLPDEQRTVIFLLEGMDYEAAAQVIGVPVGTVRSRLSRGREALRQLMGIKPNSYAEAKMAKVA